jgi:hypothetical protein
VNRFRQGGSPQPMRAVVTRRGFLFLCTVLLSTPRDAVSSRELAYPQLRFEVIDITPEMRDEYQVPTNLGSAMIGDVEFQLQQQLPKLSFGLVIIEIQGHAVLDAQEAWDQIARAWLSNAEIIRIRGYRYNTKQYQLLELPFRLIERKPD